MVELEGRGRGALAMGLARVPRFALVKTIGTYSSSSLESESPYSLGSPSSAGTSPSLSTSASPASDPDAVMMESSCIPSGVEVREATGGVLGKLESSEMPTRGEVGVLWE